MRGGVLDDSERSLSHALTQYVSADELWRVVVREMERFVVVVLLLYCCFTSTVNI